MLVSQAHRKNCTRNRLYCQRRGVRDVDPGNTKKKYFETRYCSKPGWGRLTISEGHVQG